MVFPLAKFTHKETNLLNIFYKQSRQVVHWGQICMKLGTKHVIYQKLGNFM